MCEREFGSGGFESVSRVAARRRRSLSALCSPPAAYRPCRICCTRRMAHGGGGLETSYSRAVHRCTDSNRRTFLVRPRARKRVDVTPFKFVRSQIEVIPSCKADKIQYGVRTQGCSVCGRVPIAISDRPHHSLCSTHGCQPPWSRWCPRPCCSYAQRACLFGLAPPRRLPRQWACTGTV